MLKISLFSFFLVYFSAESLSVETKAEIEQASNSVDIHSSDNDNEAKLLLAEINEAEQKQQEKMLELHSLGGKFRRNQEKIMALISRFKEISNLMEDGVSVGKYNENQLENLRKEATAAYNNLVGLLVADQELFVALEKKASQQKKERIEDFNILGGKIKSFLSTNANISNGLKNELSSSARKFTLNAEGSDEEQMRELERIAAENGEELLTAFESVLKESIMQNSSADFTEKRKISNARKTLQDHISYDPTPEEELWKDMILQTQLAIEEVKFEINQANLNSAGVLGSSNDDDEYKSAIITLGVLVALTGIAVLLVMLVLIKLVFHYHRKIASLRQQEQKGIKVEE